MTISTISRDATTTLTEPVEPGTGHEVQGAQQVERAALALDASVARSSVDALNQLLADTITLRDLYKKHHWQASGANFYSMHLLYDKHAGEQSELIDQIAERVQTLGGVSIAMAPDIAETTLIPRAPRGREETPSQLRRLLHAHEIILLEARAMARSASADPGTNDLMVSDLIRTHELQVWFLAQHGI